MTFQVAISGLEELAGRQLVTEVQIDRRLYDHSTAHIVLRWHEMDGYEDRPAPLLAAKALNCPIDITWKDNDLLEATPCFRGYVQQASAQRLPTLSVLTLSCASHSKRTDLVPRFRAFQATTLLEIATQIARTEPLIKIISPGDLQVPIALSLQHGETDFAYLTRMLHASGVPMATEDLTGRVLLGARAQEPPVPFPGADWGWSHITFAGALQALPSIIGGGTGATGLARAAAASFLGQSTRRAADYFPQTDGAALSQTHAETASLADTAGSLVHIAGAVLPFGPGHAVDLEGQQGLIHTVSITGHPNVTTASQTFQMQPGSRPLPTHRPPPSCPARSVWAFVTDNEDKDKQGRIQVEFEFEPLDPQPSGERVWLHTLTPYGGGQDAAHARLPAMPHAARAHSYTGFLSLPEVGERVLVQFHAHWDNDAVVLGSVRHGPLSPADSARDTKRWRTPSGNEVALTTEGEGAVAKDVVSVHARNHVVLEAQVGADGESVAVQCGKNYVHLISKKGVDRIEVISAGSLLIHAAGHLQMEGDSVLIKAKGGTVAVSDAVRQGVKSGNTQPSVTPKKQNKAAPKPAPQVTAPTQAGAGGSAKAGKLPGKGGKRYVVYRDANGNIREVKTGGSAAWRNNNPGNMMYDGIAQAHGAIGRNPMHDFAIFPDHQSGMDAIVGKLQSRSYQYKNGMPMTIHDAIFRWAPPTDHNDSPAYVEAIRRQTHLDPNEEMHSLSVSDLQSVANAIRVHEGTIPGTTYTPSSAGAPAWVRDLLGH